MNRIGSLFLKGLVVTIPVAMTIAIVWWFAATAERVLGGLLTEILPGGWYVPGMGLASAVGLVLLVGVLSHVLFFQKLFFWSEAWLNRLPLIKTIYTAIKDFIGYFSPEQQGQLSKVVLVTLPGQRYQCLGFVTREAFDDLPLPLAVDDAVAVYLPMSYQIGGYTLYLPRECITAVDISFEEGMRLAITGGVTRRPASPTPPAGMVSGTPEDS
ncbi:DUF502 domain-containing protein [Marinihelvus fidelis]|uniref:DUF502 domain-containing protein n=1 Tax=Marinihelvus fidelis TaxID=2613842 RepID=A0A5N0TAE9_9GAMM|nr:DUF502 domain-containing protein [Marinihelvus fidelis]KAA9132043.1 DUF502 domain-containing protein [Marinihelvus fidelis]